MTISPPAKSHVDYSSDVIVLASNIDSLYLSIYTRWKHNILFWLLKDRKKLSKKEKQNQNITLKAANGIDSAKFYVQPFGLEGYEWSLTGKEYSLKIGNWVDPILRPSIYATIHSETLWRIGPVTATQRLFNIIAGEGAEIETVLVSRVDLCVDALFSEQVWCANLGDYRVTRATRFRQYYEGKKFSGILIGSGKLLARLYDKPYEIKQESHKYWMYPIWGIKEEEIPEGFRIIRVEFQLRREAIKELLIDSISDLFEKMDDLWAYCTKKWLKFRDRPGKKSDRRKTFRWWETIQNGFNCATDAQPLVRVTSIRVSAYQLMSQILGLLTSLRALNLEEVGAEHAETSYLEDLLYVFKVEFVRNGFREKNFAEIVQNKRTAYYRCAQNEIEVREKQAQIVKPQERFRLPANNVFMLKALQNKSHMEGDGEDG